MCVYNISIDFELFSNNSINLSNFSKTLSEALVDCFKRLYLIKDILTKLMIF